MKTQTAADRFAELGHVTRLDIFRYLIKFGSNGVPVGKVKETLKIPNSTLSHHINRMINVGLVHQRREGTTLYCVPEYGALIELIDFLKDECCINE